MTSGKVVENTWVAGHTLNEVRVERRKFQYLYKDESGFNFMNTETFDQISLPESMIEKWSVPKRWDGNRGNLSCSKRTSTYGRIATTRHIEVTYTEPKVKGNTATNAMKFAYTWRRSQVKVPLFIEEGDMLKIDTRTGEYLERSNNKPNEL